jgi:hypothetical protein
MLYVGSVTIDRGLELCVQALAHLPGVHFALVGPQYQPIVEKLRAIAAQSGTTERLHIMAPVPSQSVVAYVRGADCSEYPVGKIMDERSPESIAEAVTSIIRGSQCFRPSVEQLRLIQAEYGWETQEARLRALYQELLPRRLGVASTAG